MEDLEKEKCNCCEECTCGEDCNCTPDNKCCEECTCDENCTCHSEKQECCEGECECCDDKEDCQNDKCDEQCDCGCKGNKPCDCDDDCKCNDNGEEYACDAEDDKCKCGCGESVDECDCETEECGCETEDEECKCGCGEKIESTADAYFKQLLSLQAEFDNYRKRTQSDISKAYQNGFNEAVSQFLPALDSFKMATEYITDQNTLVGIQYIEKGILSTLEKMGIEVIDTTGKFDPNFHQAIGSEVSSEHESGDIIKECFKGFKMGDKVLRYAQVIVAK